MRFDTGRIEARWREISKTAFTADRTIIERELLALIDAHRAAGRHYHTIAHIDALLALSREHRADIGDIETVDLAIFYHDAVYNSARHDNENASAALAEERLQVLGCSPARIRKVTRYILATQHVGPAEATTAGADSDLDHFLDFDLSVLASAPPAYGAYAAAIRREYAIYPDDAYARGRAGVLRKLLDLKRLYRVPALAQAWEAPARANLQRELDSLGR